MRQACQDGSADGLWLQYAGALKLPTCEGDIAWLLRNKEAMQILSEMDVNEQGASPKNATAKDVCAIHDRVLNAQLKVCMPLLENERCAFIDANHVRLSCIMGVCFWDGDEQCDKVLWNDSEGRPMEDPYELSLSELSKLPRRTKQIVMYNTYSYHALFQMDDASNRRLRFLSGLYDTLSLRGICSARDLSILFNGE